MVCFTLVFFTRVKYYFRETCHTDHIQELSIGNASPGETCNVHINNNNNYNLYVHAGSFLASMSGFFKSPGVNNFACDLDELRTE